MPDKKARRCIGSARFGIEPHDAPINEFPAQPSQKDGLGRMCKPHWRAYIAGLARDAEARKAASGTAFKTAPEPEATSAPTGKRRGAKAGAAKALPA